MVLVCSCSNWGCVGFLLNDRIRPALLFPGKFMVYESRGCECTSSCCHPSPVNWKGPVMRKMRSGRELVVLRLQARSVQWLDLPVKVIDNVVRVKLSGWTSQFH